MHLAIHKTWCCQGTSKNLNSFKQLAEVLRLACKGGVGCLVEQQSVVPLRSWHRACTWRGDNDRWRRPEIGGSGGDNGSDDDGHIGDCDCPVLGYEAGKNCICLIRDRVCKFVRQLSSVRSVGRHLQFRYQDNFNRSSDIPCPTEIHQMGTQSRAVATPVLQSREIIMPFLLGRCIKCQHSGGSQAS